MGKNEASWARPTLELHNRWWVIGGCCDWKERDRKGGCHDKEPQYQTPCRRRLRRTMRAIRGRDSMRVMVCGLEEGGDMGLASTRRVHTCDDGASDIEVVDDVRHDDYGYGYGYDEVKWLNSLCVLC
jgi:hypothetical protein